MSAFNSIEQFRDAEGGVLLVDKPTDWTSFDVVKKLRAALRVKKVGHAGTLDPLATGLLILCSQRMTKSIENYQSLEKLYEGRLRLGATTKSYDSATEIENICSIDGIGSSAVHDATTAFIGDISQLPPMYSAVKVKGQRLYTLARKGIEVERELRTITIREFEIDAADLPDVSFRVACSKGTYIRTLVHDLGQQLGCGAYLTELRRTAIGSYTVKDAWTIDRILENISDSSWPQSITGQMETERIDG